MAGNKWSAEEVLSVSFTEDEPDTRSTPGSLYINMSRGLITHPHFTSVHYIGHYVVLLDELSVARSDGFPRNKRIRFEIGKGKQALLDKMMNII